MRSVAELRLPFIGWPVVREQPEHKPRSLGVALQLAAGIWLQLEGLGFVKCDRTTDADSPKQQWQSVGQPQQYEKCRRARCV